MSNNESDSKPESIVPPVLLVEYDFPFIFDPNLTSNPKREQILDLAGPEKTQLAASRAIQELQINQNVTISRLIPPVDQYWRINPETGIASRTPTPTTVELLFDPENPNTIESLLKWGERQIAHELSHVARMETRQLHPTLLDAILSEGIGVYYEENWQGNFLPSFWGNVLTNEKIFEEWDLAIRDLQNNDFDFGDWFYGRNNGHPKFTGYSLGNALINSFMQRNPGVSIAELARMDSAVIFANSGF